MFSRIPSNIFKNLCFYNEFTWFYISETLVFGSFSWLLPLQFFALILDDFWHRFWFNFDIFSLLCSCSFAIIFLWLWGSFSEAGSTFTVSLWKGGSGSRYCDIQFQNVSWSWFGWLFHDSGMPQNLKNNEIHITVVQNQASTEQLRKHKLEVPGPDFLRFWSSEISGLFIIKREVLP